MIVLPKEAYTSKAWFDKEMRYLFSKTWTFAGFTEDLVEAGDYLTVQAGLTNLMVVKGPDMRLRAFHNLCRHRGTQLLRAAGKAKKALTCPYHDWTYSLNGELTSVPRKEQEFPGLDMKKLCLFKASVETWKGMIWVHPDPKAQSLLHWLEGAGDHIGPHRVEDLVEYPDAASTHEIAANWKIVAENYIDGYHLAHLHSNTLDMYDHDNQETGFIGPHFVFYEPLTKDFAANLKSRCMFPPIDHFTAEKPLGAYVPMLFPALGLSATESTWSTFKITPLAPDRTRVDIRLKVLNVSKREYDKQYARAIWSYKDRGGKYQDAAKDDPMNSGDFMVEDIYACEQQQKSLSSPMFAVGATAQVQEASVVGFQERVAAFLERREREEQTGVEV